MITYILGYIIFISCNDYLSSAVEPTNLTLFAEFKLTNLDIKFLKLKIIDALILESTFTDEYEALDSLLVWSF